MKIQNARFWSCVTAFFCLTFFTQAQTLYVPGGTSGIGSTTSQGVGIGTGYPYAKLQITNDGLSRTTGFYLSNTTPSSASYTLHNAAQ
ncbi:MAG: hypothetical protein AAFR59_14505, partial [Bacteroidota bacterium]